MTIRVVLAAALLSVCLAACVGGPQVAPALEVIEMKKAGADDVTILRWVNDPERTFDLTVEDVTTLVAAEMGEPIINAMLAKSEEHHREEGHSDAHSHEH